MTTAACARLKNDRGVTLIEVMTAMFVMGIGILAILTLFPLGMLSMRRAVHEDRAIESLGHLALARAAFTTWWGVPPRSLKDLTPLLDGDDRYGDGEDSGYLFVLDGGERLTAVPAAPGKTGIRHFCTAQAEVYDCTRREDVFLARASQQRMRLNLLLSAGASAAEILKPLLIDATRPPLKGWPNPSAARQRALDRLDADRNGAVTFREMLQVAEPDTPLGRFFETVRVQLELGAGDEDIDGLPGVPRTALLAQPVSLWAVSTLRELSAFLVADPGTFQDLERLLHAAEAAEVSRDLAARGASLDAYIDRVERAAGRSITRVHAGVLVTLARLTADLR